MRQAKKRDVFILMFVDMILIDIYRFVQGKMRWKVEFSGGDTRNGHTCAAMFGIGSGVLLALARNDAAWVSRGKFAEGK
jgi:hypothetical protein